jgi:hypothetical protein
MTASRSQASSPLIVALLGSSVAGGQYISAKATQDALFLATLRIAFRGLHTDDQVLRGTSLEYLQSVLPPDIRDQLWPFLENQHSPEIPRPGDATLAALLRSNESIRINLEELRKRAARRVNS